MPARSAEDTHAQLAAAFNAGDLDALAEVYEENATLIVPPDGQLVSGRAEIRRALALTHARWRLVGTGAEGRLVELAGSGSIVSRQQPDGTWRIVLDNPLSPR